MVVEQQAKEHLAQEARSLLARVEILKPFSLQMPMVPAAAIAQTALAAIEKTLATGKRELMALINQFLHWLEQGAGQQATAKDVQRRLTILRLRFNAVLTQLDIFADVLSQRGEHDTGVWMAGLDALAADALKLEGEFFRPPPLICYLDRGAGAAIRRVKTRLPGGGENPVAVIRVPRERMIGCGIASSLVHEVGHQGAALLGLVESLRPALRNRQKGEGTFAFRYFERTIAEILADFWAVAMLGITATKGLMAVLSLPRPFMFRINPDDPHPFPWIRVKISCSLGKKLYPHPQWARLEGIWESIYPLKGVPDDTRRVIDDLERHLPLLMQTIVEQRPAKLNGKRVGEVFPVQERTTARLAEKLNEWRLDPGRMKSARPCTVFATLGAGQATTPSAEGVILENLIKSWAVSKRKGVTNV